MLIKRAAPPATAAKEKHHREPWVSEHGEVGVNRHQHRRSYDQCSKNEPQCDTIRYALKTLDQATFVESPHS